MLMGKGKKVEDIVKPSVDDSCKSCLSNHRLYRTYLLGRSQKIKRGFNGEI